MSITCRLRSAPRLGRPRHTWWVTGGQVMRANDLYGESFDCSTFYCKHGLKRALRQAFGKTCRATG